MSKPLFATERRRIILDKLRQQGRVSVDVLSDELAVSAVTIRKDLRLLQRQGLAERTYGGAVLQDRQPLVESAFFTRRTEQRAEKEALARAAAALVQEGYGIALGASTTACLMAPYLKALDNLTVVTNSLYLAQDFSDAPQIRVLMPGGRVLGEAAALVEGMDSVPQVHLNLGFFSAWGITPEEGTTEINPDLAAIKRALVDRCRAVTVLVDSGKWGRVAPYPGISLSRLTQVMTTTLADADEVRAMRAAGIPVEVVAAPPQQAE